MNDKGINFLSQYVATDLYHKKIEIWHEIFNITKANFDLNGLIWCFKNSGIDSLERKLCWAFITTIDSDKKEYIKFLSNIFLYKNIDKLFIWSSIYKYAKNNDNDYFLTWCKDKNILLFYKEKFLNILPNFIYNNVSNNNATI